MLVSGSYDTTLRIWNLADKQVPATAWRGSRPVHSLTQRCDFDSTGMSAGRQLVGIFNTLRDLCFGPTEIRVTGARASAASRIALCERRARRCQIEELEPRRLMAADVAPHVLLGSVYFEEATGDDSQPDIIQVSFVGGAAGTTLNRAHDQRRQAPGRPHRRRHVLRHGRRRPRRVSTSPA